MRGDGSAANPYAIEPVGTPCLMTPRPMPEDEVSAEIYRAAARAAIIGAIKEIDALKGNEIYERAWKKAMVRLKTWMIDTYC